MVKMKRLFTICLSMLLIMVLTLPVDANAATDVHLTKTKVALYVGQSTTLKLNGAKVKKWKSNDKNIATVNKNGKITAKKKGTTTIIATAKNGKTYKCKVTVKNVTLSKTKVTLEKGKSVTLKLNGSKVVKWSSDNKKIATVNSKGKVVAKGVGTTTIKAKAKNGKTYKCKVVVSKKDIYPDTSNYTEDEKKILNIFETTFREAGLTKFTDLMTQEEIDEYGLDIGMGHIGVFTTLSDAQEVAKGTADAIINTLPYSNSFYITEVSSVYGSNKVYVEISVGFPVML